MSCYNFVSRILPKKKKEQEDMPDSDTVLSLKRLLHDQSIELRKRQEIIEYLQKELNDKDNEIKYLKNEIDKFRQVVSPLTQKIITKQISFLDDSEKFKLSISNNNVEQRIKRQAISAEPLALLAEGFKIEKFPKSAE
ncbi:putative Cgmp-dependent protein kinase [Trypoxylus dichotomus]